MPSKIVGLPDFVVTPVATNHFMYLRKVDSTNENRYNAWSRKTAKEAGKKYEDYCFRWFSVYRYGIY